MASQNRQSDITFRFGNTSDDQVKMKLNAKVNFGRGRCKELQDFITSKAEVPNADYTIFISNECESSADAAQLVEIAQGFKENSEGAPFAEFFKDVIELKAVENEFIIVRAIDSASVQQMSKDFKKWGEIFGDYATDHPQHLEVLLTSPSSFDEVMAMDEDGFMKNALKGLIFRISASLDKNLAVKIAEIITSETPYNNDYIKFGAKMISSFHHVKIDCNPNPENSDLATSVGKSFFQGIFKELYEMIEQMNLLDPLKLGGPSTKIYVTMPSFISIEAKMYFPGSVAAMDTFKE